MGNVLRKPASIHTFKQDLSTARGVICNSGFELISECLQWNKPVLTRPLAGQMEQLSNAMALQQLGYARVVQTLDEVTLRRWLEQPVASPGITFPDVAAALADWLVDGCQVPVSTLGDALWRDTFGGAMFSPSPQRAA